MLSYLRENWWMLALRGVAAILFGLGTFLWPGLTLLVVVLLFGAYALADGVLALASAVRSEGGGSRWLLLLEGVSGLAAGAVAFLWPGLTAVTVLYLIAAWAIVTGGFEVVQAVRLRREVEGEWMLGLAGVLSILFGLGVAAFPAAGAVAVAWLIGSYALFFGALLLGLAWRVRGERPPQELRRAA